MPNGARTRRTPRRAIPVSAPAPGTGALDHIAFNATDYDELLANLERAGVQAYRNIVSANGLRQVFLLDPNGIKLEINIWTKA
ncbi:MAG TPA: hypothetical protein VG994_04165 [Steroidobacteraceae bacterium]|nr:hypothetical protein [Steroidobacteraceae bacterium]